MKKVLLLSCPFGALERPSLGLSLLKARLQEESIACDVKYLGFPFADQIGVENYQWMTYELPYTAFAGDWCFTSALYEKDEVPSPDDYVTEILQGTWHLSDETIRRILFVRSYVPSFLEYCLSSIDWEDYAIVGFTSTFEQNIASLALAKRLKQRNPEVVTVFGGANWEGDMGEELHSRFKFVDYVCSGESEESFPKLVKHILAGSTTETIESEVKGIVLRKNGKSVATGFPDTTFAMDSFPYPDFSDYFTALQESTASNHVLPSLLLETSRGCWWGAKSHCTFCGLNGNTMSFRSKSPRRVLDELDVLSSKWRTESVEVVDNILDMKYFDNVIPALAKAKRSFQIFYEVKSNLNRQHVKMLSDAGINRIQPGIESLSDHVLKLMRKGTTGLRNIQLLKWSKELNVHAEWNLLYGFPGETEEDYDNILAMLPAIKFLGPPCAVGPIRLDRFSPYFNSPEEFGLTALRPMVTYRHLYPFPATSLARIAYYYEFEYQSNVDPGKCAAKVVSYIQQWKSDHERGSLFMFTNADGIVTIMDTRSDTTVGQIPLDATGSRVYEYCDEVRSLSNIVAHLRELFPDGLLDEASVKTFLDSLVANRLMVTDGSNYLSLAIRIPSVDRSEDRIEYVTTEDYQRPLSSYLRKEMPVVYL